MMEELAEIQESEFKEIAEFIAQHNSTSDQRCLHCPIEAEMIFEEMKDLQTRKEVHLIKLTKQGELKGVFGCDCDEERVRIWFWGPFVSTSEDWNELGEKMYAHFMEITPQAKAFVAYTDLENTRARAFYDAKGFKERKDKTYVYQLNKENYKKVDLEADPSIQVFEPIHKEELDRVHKLHFPTAYYTTEEMIELDLDKNRVFVKVNEANALEGYILVSVTGGNRGFIHFLAVDEASRGKGLGSKLIRTGINWLLEEQQVPSINLTVDEKNNAQYFYQKLGFHFLYAGVGAFLNLEPKN